MSLYTIKLGSYTRDGVTYNVGDVVELSDQRAERLPRGMVEAIKGENDSGNAERDQHNMTTTTTTANPDDSSVIVDDITDLSFLDGPASDVLKVIPTISSLEMLSNLYTKEEEKKNKRPTVLKALQARYEEVSK